jgi:uncharacterized membrane protein
MNKALAIQGQERWASALGGAALVVWGAQRLSTRRAGSGAMIATTGAGLLWRASREGAASRHAGARGIIVEQAVAINRSAEDLFAFWRRLEQLPMIIPELRSVRQIDHRRSEWVASVVGGRVVRWHAEIINEMSNALIAWRTVGRSDLETQGSIHFDPRDHDRGTAVRIKLQYDPPAGAAGAAAAWLAGDSPNQVLREGLRRFKQLMETGEIATTEHQPRGAR